MAVRAGSIPEAAGVKLGYDCQGHWCELGRAGDAVSFIERTHGQQQLQCQ